MASLVNNHWHTDYPDICSTATVSTVLIELMLEYAAFHAAVTTLSQELGLDEDDFVRIPSLFRARDGKAVFHVPSMVNLLVDRSNLVIADPFGPRKNGDDAFKADVRENFPDSPFSS